MFPEMKGNVESKALHLHDNITVLGPQSSQLLCDWRVDSIRRGLMEKKKKGKKKEFLLEVTPLPLIKLWPIGKCLTTKHHQTLFSDQTFLPFGHLV